RGFGLGDAFGEHPGLGRVEGLVDLVGLGHDPADGAAVFTRLEVGPHLTGAVAQFGLHRAGVAGVGQRTVEVAGDEGGRPAGDVDVLADQVAVDAGDEVVRVEVQVFDVGVELGGDVVAQPFGVHADVQVAQRGDPRAPALGHLFAADRDEAVHVQHVGDLAAGELQHRRPEQGVDVDDVLADEVHLLGVAGRRQQGVEVQAVLAAVGLQGGQVADRSVEPGVEVLARGVGDGDAEVGLVAGNVPVGQVGFGAFGGAQPFARLGED